MDVVPLFLNQIEYPSLRELEMLGRPTPETHEDIYKAKARGVSAIEERRFIESLPQRLEA